MSIMFKKIILILIAVVLLSMFFSGYTKEQTIKKDEAYKKYVQVCSSVLSAESSTDEYTFIHMCNEECKEQFLNNKVIFL